MQIDALNPILNVTSVPESIEWFERIGWSREFTWNEHGMIEGEALENEHGPATFAGICATGLDGQRSDIGIFLCQNGQGARDPDTRPDPDREDYGGVWMSWWVEDVDGAHRECLTLDVEVIRPPQDRPWGMRECLIRHPDGHCFRLGGPARQSD